MANALATLFHDIAEAIRVKTGGTETMAPLDFPNEILSIVVGEGGAGDSGEGSSGITDGEYRYGTVYPKTSTNVITHNMGYVPDVIVIYSAYAPVSGKTYMAIGFSFEMHSAIDGLQSTGIYNLGSSDSLMAYTQTETGFDVLSTGDKFQIYNVNDTSFSISYLDTEAQGTTQGTQGCYRWFAIGGLKGAGGASGAVKVKFCNYDGTELFSRQVFIGDDCPDPIEQDKMTTPTRESTVQYTYAYNGWSLTEGGTADSSALKNITAKKTVYAAFAENVRYYTVRFYDGNTLMKTEQVAYGSQATPPDTTKDGCTFAAWQPSDLTITGDTNFYGTWIEKVSFSGSSWAKISEMCENGEAAENFAVGDEKVFTSADGSVSYKVRIIGMGLDTKSGGSGKAGITVMLTNADGTVVRTRAWESYGEAWQYAAIRSSDCRTTVYNLLPEDLRNVIKTVSKKTMYKYEGKSYTDTLDETIFIPSAYEVGHTASLASTFTDDGFRYPGLDETSEKALGTKWFTRTMNSSSTIFVVSATGGVGYSDAVGKSDVCGVVPCFCI